MSDNKLIILCDEIRTGKTTAINDSLQYLRPSKGFICPDIDGSRKLVDLNTMKIHEFQIKKAIYSNDIKVGKFVFLGKTFKLAHDILNGIPNDFKGYVIIDEIGKLELKDSGLEPALSTFLKRRTELKATLILVIRDYLLEEVRERYNLKNALVMNPDTFKSYFKNSQSHV